MPKGAHADLQAKKKKKKKHSDIGRKIDRDRHNTTQDIIIVLKLTCAQYY